MKSISKLLVCSLVLVAASACGGSKNGGSGVGAAGAYESDGKTCSAQIKTDAEPLTQPITHTLEGLKAYRAKLAAFLDKYKGVVCTSPADATGGPQTIDVSEAFGKLLKQLDDAIAQAQAGAGGNPPAVGDGGAILPEGQNCSATLINEMRQLGQHTVTNLEELRTFRAQLVAFGEKYRGVVCNALGENGQIQSVDVNARINKAVQEVDAALAQHPHG